MNTGHYYKATQRSVGAQINSYLNTWAHPTRRGPRDCKLNKTLTIQAAGYEGNNNPDKSPDKRTERTVIREGVRWPIARAKPGPADDVLTNTHDPQGGLEKQE